MSSAGSASSRDDAARIQREAGAWLRRLNSGSATQRDVQGFRRWRDAHPAHGQALQEARRVWALMPQAMAPMAGRDTASAAARRPRARGLPRRMVLLGGAVGVAGAAAAAVAVHPPLALWPSIGELQADYRTATGEQRELDLAGGVSLQLNTQTALSRLRGEGQGPGVRLVNGEIAVDLGHAGSTAFEVAAGAGRVLAQGAQLEVRHLADVTWVTCIDGAVRVWHPDGARELQAGQQLRYDAHGLQPTQRVEVAEWSAWRRGVLVFRAAPLEQVIEEINRYRPGKVLLWASHLREREVSGRFSVSTLDTVLLQIERSYELQARSLPGGVVVLR
ncbi:FecR family protein [Hydrogenophaga palleronii]|uniref:FecR family protein n=1 Tax=Hydrogenophaga palleronii TaxID=65655 RepID=UPI00082692C0|nr:FecR domain-containing protein [Hydrogenophaga palleronii]